MKKIIFIIAVNFVAISANAQVCSRTVSSFIKAKGGYDIAGQATLENNNGSIMLSFNEKFNTVSGPDLHVYLSQQNASPTLSGNANVLIAAIKSNTGAQSFIVPNDVNISDYDYVTIHCVLGNHFWGGGLLSSITGTCKVTAIDDELVAAQPKLIYDSNSQLLTLENVDSSAEILIYNILGTVVFKGNYTNAISMNQFNAGIYILRNEKSVFKFNVN